MDDNMDTTTLLVEDEVEDDTTEDTEIYYTKQSKVLAIAPKIPALLSILGSSYIIYNIRQQRYKNSPTAKRNELYHQLMLGLSICDIVASHIYFLGTFLIPRNSNGPFGWVYWAVGTDATCSYSGFFNQFAVASPIYNTMLSIYFLLKIRYNWSTTTLTKMGYPIFHGIPWMIGLGTAFFALLRQPNTLYGNVFWTCWINPTPPQDDFRWFQWSFLFGPVWVCVFLQTICMTLLFQSIRSVEKTTKVTTQKIATQAGNVVQDDDDDDDDSSNVDENENEKNIIDEDEMDDEDEENEENDEENTIMGKKLRTKEEEELYKKKQQKIYSRMICIQGMLYVGAFYITWFFPTVQRIRELLNLPGIFALQALDTSLLPLQGLFNVIIFLRPKYVFYRNKYPDLPRRGIVKMVHDRTRETTIVAKYSTRMNATSTNNRHNKTNNNNTSSPSGAPNGRNNTNSNITQNNKSNMRSNDMTSQDSNPNRVVGFADDKNETKELPLMMPPSSDSTTTSNTSTPGTATTAATGTTYSAEQKVAMVIAARKERATKARAAQIAKAKAANPSPSSPSSPPPSTPKVEQSQQPQQQTTTSPTTTTTTENSTTTMEAPMVRGVSAVGSISRSGV